MRIFRVAAGVLLLGLALGAPGAFASPRSTGHVSPARTVESGDLLLQVKTFLVSLWAEEGCRIDPWGRCVTGTTAPQVPATDAGCRLDPLGRCITSP